jgi:hypothetical protein
MRRQDGRRLANAPPDAASTLNNDGKRSTMKAMILAAGKGTRVRP